MSAFNLNLLASNAAPVDVIGHCLDTGALRRVPARAQVAVRYDRLVALNASAARVISDEELRVIVDDLAIWEVSECERVLAILANHGSATAFELIAELRMDLPDEVKDFAELAFASALGWLGFSYERDHEDTAPVVRAAA